MKCPTLSILLSFFSILLRPVLVSGQSPEGFPPVYEMSEHSDEIITIVKPGGNRWYGLKGLCAADINRDGYDDIILKCDSLIARPGAVEHSYAVMMPVIYIIYGNPNLPRRIYLDSPPVHSMVLRFHEFSPFRIADVKCGDVNGDGLIDFVFSCQWWPITGNIVDVNIESKLGVYYGEERNRRGVYDIDVSSDKLRKFSDAERNLKQKFIDNYEVADLDGDLIDDILLLYYYGKQGADIVMYLIHGGDMLPLNTDLGDEDPGIDVTTITGDTLNSELTHSLAAGDFDGDKMQDIIMCGGYIWRTGESIAHVLYGSLFSHYRSYSNYSLSDPLYGKGRILRARENIPNLINDHVVAAADMNGDGCDEMILGFPRYLSQGIDPDPRKYLNAQISVLHGAREQLISVDLGARSDNLLVIESAQKGDLMGGDFAGCDVNGDGYEDLLIAGADSYYYTDQSPSRRLNLFYVVYGSGDLPDSITLRENELGVSQIKGSVFFDAGDINGDGSDDIYCSEDSVIFIIPGRGGEFAQHETVSFPIPRKDGAYRHLNFADGGRLSLAFARGRPLGDAEARVTYFGRNLPDSLSFISTGAGGLSYFDVELAGSFTEYQLVLTTSYSDSLLSALGIMEGNLIVSRWDEGAGSWKRMEISVDTLQHNISFATDHLSLFAVADTGNHVISALSGMKTPVPVSFNLEQNYPNPFNPSTMIRYVIPAATEVTLTVYNILGQEVIRLVDDFVEPGENEVRWDGRDRAGNPVSSGIYFYRLKTPDYTAVKKMLLIR